MTCKLAIAIAALLAAPALADPPAGQDEKPRAVRATSTVEVIDDARQVDDIIARVRAQRQEVAAKSEVRPAAAAGPRRDLERVPVSTAREREDRAREKAQRREHHERPQRVRR